ncbi:MAG: hypothetical protein ACLFRI_01025 [Candidatus Izemoplasmataceae bacterium]
MINNRKNKDSLAYYALIFLGISIGLLIFGFLFPSRRDGLSYNEWIAAFWFYPFLVVFVIFFYRKVTKKMFKRLDKQNEERQFVLHMSKVVKDELGYEIEDFRRLRENEKFQKALLDAYTIYQDGETQLINYDTLSRKFDPKSKEFDAVTLIIRELKILREKK